MDLTPAAETRTVSGQTRSYADLRKRDYQAVQEILAGSLQSWDSLYSHAYCAVLRCASIADFPRLLCTADYRDAADEAFALCFQQLERYQGLSRFAYWVGGYARNLIRNRRRSELTRVQGLNRLSRISALDMWGQDPLVILIRAERDHCLRHAFQELTAGEQRILWQRSVYCLSMRKLAQDLSLPVPEAARQHAAALQHLKERFLYHYYGPHSSTSKPCL